jgi:hypothetical protein
MKRTIYLLFAVLFFAACGNKNAEMIKTAEQHITANLLNRHEGANIRGAGLSIYTSGSEIVSVTADRVNKISGKPAERLSLMSELERLRLDKKQRESLRIREQSERRIAEIDRESRQIAATGTRPSNSEDLSVKRQREAEELDRRLKVLSLQDALDINQIEGVRKADGIAYFVITLVTLPEGEDLTVTLVLNNKGEILNPL